MKKILICLILILLIAGYAFAGTTILSKKAATLKIGISLKSVVKLLGNPTWLILSTDGGEFEGAVPLGLYQLMWENGDCLPVSVHFNMANKVTGWDEGRSYCGSDVKAFNPNASYSIQNKNRNSFYKSKLKAPKISDLASAVNDTKAMAKEVGRDGIFIAYASGVVYDKKTGLEWYAGPDNATTWNEAKAWVESLNVAGGGWRLPRPEELKTLYKKGAGKRNMTPLLKATGWWVWSIEMGGTKLPLDSNNDDDEDGYIPSGVARFFNFASGSESRFYKSSSAHRGFAVRSRR